MTSTPRAVHLMQVIAESPHYYELSCQSCDRFVIFVPDLTPAFNIVRVGDLSALHIAGPVEYGETEITTEAIYLRESARFDELLGDLDLDDPL